MCIRDRHVPIISDKKKELIKQKAMEVFGGNFIEIIIGGAPFNTEVEAFLKMIDFPYTCLLYTSYL